MAKAYLLLADGFELVEAMTPIDVFRRANIDIKTVSISSHDRVKSSNNVEVKADLKLRQSSLDDGDMLILPGGYPGYVNLCNSKEAGTILKSYFDAGKYIAAICAAPTVLAVNDIGQGRKVTCHSCAIDTMKAGGYLYTDEDVVCDGNIITADGAGHSLAFSLCMAELLADWNSVLSAKKGMELV